MWGALHGCVSVADRELMEQSEGHGSCVREQNNAWNDDNVVVHLEMLSCDLRGQHRCAHMEPAERRLLAGVEDEGGYGRCLYLLGKVVVN